MEKNTFISFLTPPFPYFIEGDMTCYKKGQKHPKRSNLGFFDVIIIKKGVLYLGEEDCKWKMYPGEVLILEPDKQHYPIEPCLEDTQFYWLHFQTKNKWCVQNESENIDPNDTLTKKHFYSDYNTIHLKKNQKLGNPNELFNMLDLLFDSTLKIRSLAFWETQQVFMQVLQRLEYNHNHQRSSLQLAERIEIYLRKNYKARITNTILTEHFHTHENYLARCMKESYNCTPLEYLANYRLNQGRLLLLKTDFPLSVISEEVGFSQLSYFSKCFKDKYGVSPHSYRKHYWNHNSKEKPTI